MKTKSLSILVAITIMIIAFGCKKNSPTPAATASNTATSGSYFVQATINGTAIKHTEGIGGYISYAYGFIDTSWFQVTNKYFEVQYLCVLSTTNNIDEIDVAFWQQIPGNSISTPLTGTFIESMISVKSYPYAILVMDTINGTFNQNNGVVIQYTDKNGVIWSSQFGDQTGSTFNVTSHTAHPDPTNTIQGEYSHDITEANFSCMLYDPNNGSSKMKLTGGAIKSKSLSYK